MAPAIVLLFHMDDNFFYKQVDTVVITGTCFCPDLSLLLHFFVSVCCDSLVVES